MEEGKNYIVWSSRNGTSGWYVVECWDVDHEEKYLFGPYLRESDAVKAASDNNISIVKEDDVPKEKASKTFGFN